ncbi:MAG TPA: hypothetical protein VEO36_11205 [Casimicrobiaceae bacterium]|nr:hypothetical protein [Casimicrobiaceae bacterium]
MARANEYERARRGLTVVPFVDTLMNWAKSLASVRYDSNRSFGLDAVIWLIPAAIIVVLACMIVDELVFPSERLISMTPTPYSKAGSADQYFEAIVTSDDDFDARMAKVNQSPNALDSVAYRAHAARGIARAALRAVADDEARRTPSTDTKVRLALPVMIDP